MPVRKLAAVAVASLAALLALAPAALAAPHVDGHFPMPTIDTNNAKLVAGPDGNMWMPIEDGADDIAKIALDGSVAKYDLVKIEDATGIAVGPENLLWITAINKVASFSPADPVGSVKTFTIATVTSKNSIVAGPDGNMWVAADDNVVRFSPSDPEKATPFPIAELTPKDIDVAGSGLVVAGAGQKLAYTVSTSGVVGKIPLLGTTSTSQGVAGRPNGEIAFSKSDGTEGLGFVTPPAAPTAIDRDGDPFGVALGSDNAFYFARAFGKDLQRVAPDGTVTSISGIPPAFVFRQIAPGPNNTMWATMEVPGEPIHEIARISGLEPPVKPIDEPKPTAPETTIDKGPKGKVTTRKKKAAVAFKFSSPTAGVTFECALIKPTLKSKPPKFAAPGQQGAAGYKACTSPFGAKRKPGRYRFFVRAVNAGVPDPTPATRTFRVVREAKKKKKK